MKALPTEGHSVKSVASSFGKPREAHLEVSICHYLRIKGIFFWKQANRGYFDPKKGRFRKDWNPYTRRGVPDLILIVNGQFVGLEVKSARGSQSDEQRQFQQECERHGGKYFVVRSLEDVENVLKGI